ncbi:MAG: hypothetical protein A3I77_00665 [Gammaproteobacteria bacterium RIFCSPLOWO2_02_FULL_42_14]|nr:MAG: hypothetical protein A3B71_08750 [Gammaproteobacteria bacterium RIFCSPHIGHO2_02_FULL_42_43]OGT28596.1 MAG: hypothetical protein A2624_06520 [Gammaproteobacteria bacterium RIFCSPHIGHO2_01_FULL_42_8]OGT50796.1 MAG: hypothetical protein A3E54_00945 [Gammaproteobacteria bacterium RIFCSPHIGHO2_12_FULL_41_25]OGT61780.1 MAG: hypothetical protein A3I77_00665 [Gammaproteobacteria bacterium RIFCSPLOWO2_02_FULL_42_14]OGT85525.1 MAG: hypothetical protein A3G86_06855 [Gammaproteobacteria bacterium R
MLKKQILTYSILSIVILTLVIGGYAYYLHDKRYPGTNDAYVQAHVVDIAPQVTGEVSQVFAHNHALVKKGQPLFSIDPKPFEIALVKAKANLDNTQQQVIAAENAVTVAKAQVQERKAELLNTEKNYDRIAPLVLKNFYSKAAGDNVIQELAVAKQAVAAAEAQLAQAQATLGKTGDQNARIQAATAAIAEAQLNLQYTNINAPADGEIAQLTLRPGQMVTAYQSLFSLVENKEWWVMANMKETKLSRIRVGQSAVIYVDMYPTHPFNGVVKSIGPGSGASFALLPAENATGNWVKVTQRFPVRIQIINPSSQFPLRIGASCTVTIDTQSQ